MKAAVIAITGGDCAGKTMARAYLKENLSDLGWRVLLVPEIATFLGEQGFGVNDIIRSGNKKRISVMEKSILLLQTHLEEAMETLAGECYEDERVVILCDRGKLDVKAFTGKREFRSLLKQAGLDILTARDMYAGVIHLVTTAYGAERFFTLENNPMRAKRTLKQARRLDDKIKTAWLGHPHLVVIDNSTDFENKLKRTLAAVCHILGIPDPREIERAFLVASMSTERAQRILRDFSVPFVTIGIEQAYIDWPGDEEVRIRQRTQEGASLYYQTHKLRIASGERSEREFGIDGENYAALLDERVLKNKDILRKDRICFLWENQYFELDIFREPKRLRRLARLEIELTDRQADIAVPPFLPILAEVTDSLAFSNEGLAERTRSRV